MPKYRVSELEGTLLDAAVAKADGILVTEADEHPDQPGLYRRLRNEWCDHIVRWYGESGEEGGWESLATWGSPSADWDAGGPIIDREKIGVAPALEHCDWYGDWLATRLGWEGQGTYQALGPTPLIAAMRAYVASKQGEEVELP